MSGEKCDSSNNNGKLPETCRDEFARIRKALERIDIALRGNGVPGVQTRLDRLERSEAIRTRLVWAVVIPTVALVITNVWNLLQGASRVLGD